MADSGKGKVLQNTGKFVSENRAEGWVAELTEIQDLQGFLTILNPRDDFFNEAGYRQSRENDKIDSKYGFDRVKDSQERTGYLINMHSVS